MVRSLWIGLSVIALALTGTAWGQPAPVPAAPVVPTRRPPPARTAVVQSGMAPAATSVYGPMSAPASMPQAAPVVPNRAMTSLPVVQQGVPANTRLPAPDPLARVL